MDYYPVYLNLSGRRCVVIGGGAIAEGKVAGLLEAGARVRIVAPELTPALAEWARAGRLEHEARAYYLGDLAGAFLAIGATDDPAVNAAVVTEAEAASLLPPARYERLRWALRARERRTVLNLEAGVPVG